MIIKSSENLCSDYDLFSKLARTTGEPLYITKDGEGDTVLLSIEAFEEITKVSIERNMLGNSKYQKEINKMSEYFYGKILRKMYETASKGLQVANIHLFGIYYADVLESERLNKKEILRAANLPESYQTEIAKGMNLAKYTQVLSSEIQRIKEIETECK